MSLSDVLIDVKILDRSGNKTETIATLRNFKLNRHPAISHPVPSRCIFAMESVKICRFTVKHFG